MSQNGTGVEHPTIELGGRVYTVRMERGMLYDMAKLGIKYAPKFTPSEENPAVGTISMDLVQIVDMLHLMTGFTGTHRQLTELVYDKRSEAVSVIAEAWGKAFPLPQPLKLQEPAGQDQVKQ